MPTRVVFLDLHTSFLGAQRVLVDFLERAPEQVRPAVVCAGEARMVRELSGLGVPHTVVPMPASIAGVTRRGPLRGRAILAVSAYRTALRRAVLDLAPGVVVANTPKAYVMGALATPRGVPLGIRLHDILPPSPRLRLVARALGSRCHSVSCVSDAVRRSARELGFPARCLTTLHNGAPQAERLAPPPEPAAGPTVGLVAQLEPWKGQDLAMAAFAESLALDDGSRLRIIGRPVKSDLFRRLLANRAEELGIVERVAFEPHREERREIYAGLDALLHLPRRPEPFGMVLVEAMAFGIPVVAAAEGGALEIIEDEVSGLLVPPDDAHAAARALRRLMHEPGLAGHLTANARRTVETRLSADRYVTGLAEWITAMVA